MRDLSHEIEQATLCLEGGGVILYPTDTIWGLGCDMDNARSIEKLLSLKARSSNKGFILLVDDVEELDHWVQNIPNNLKKMLEEFTKPVTIVFDCPGERLPKKILKEGKIAIRVTKHYFCKQLIRKFGKPLISTSANISGAGSPTNTLESVSAAVRTQVDYVANAGDRAGTGLPSAIIEVFPNGNHAIILRH